MAFEARVKLGYAPVKAAINFVGGYMHSTIKNGYKFMRLANKLQQSGGRGITMTNKLGKTIHIGNMDNVITHPLAKEYIGHRIGLESPLTSVGQEAHESGVRIDEGSVTTTLARPLGAYNRAELTIRPKAFLSGYLRARWDGIDHEESIKIGIESARLTQGLYNMAALPVLIGRGGAPLKASFQFKQYLWNEVRFMRSLTPAEWAKYVPYIVLMAGTRGALMTLGSIVKLIPVFGVLLGSSMDDFNQWMNEKAPSYHRGLWGVAMGIDVSAPASWQLPTQASDWGGTLYKDLGSTIELFMTGMNRLMKTGDLDLMFQDQEVNNYFRQVLPVLYNAYAGMQIQASGEVREGSPLTRLSELTSDKPKTTRLVFESSKPIVDAFIAYLGGRSVQMSKEVDTARYYITKQREATDRVKLLTDEYLAAMAEGDKGDMIDAYNQLLELKGSRKQTNSDLRRALKSRHLTSKERAFKLLSKQLKREVQ
jgi:hypothetical protein